MGEWVRVEDTGRRASKYASKKYQWVGDDEYDLPTEEDYRYLYYTLEGSEYKPLVEYDDRAGEPKRPNTSGGGYLPGGKRQAVIFDKDFDLNKNDKKRLKSDLAPGREYFSPVRVDYSPTSGRPTGAMSPGGTEYDVGPSYGPMHMVHLTYESGFGIDTYGTNFTPNKSPLPKLKKRSGTIQLTKQLINSFSGTRSEDGLNTLSVMSSISALDAARRAGVEATGNWAWLHLIAYSMGGQNGKTPDVPENLVAGTARSNYYHLAIESAAKKIVTTTGKPVNITWKLKGNVDEDWHLAEIIKYTVSDVSDPTKTAEFEIKTWSHESGYGGDTNAVYSYMVNVCKIGT